MKDVFPGTRALILADSYFATTLGGFKNSDLIPKVFDESDGYNGEHPFLSIDVRPNKKDRNSWWTGPDVIISATGPNHVDGAYLGKVTLYKLCEEVERIIRANNCLPAVVDGGLSIPAIQYEVMGDSSWDQGENPVLEMVTVSVALRLGIVSAS